MKNAQNFMLTVMLLASISSQAATQNPQSKNDRFLAHTRFKALMTLLSGGHYRVLDAKSSNTLDEQFEKFVQECRKEIKENQTNQNK